MDFIRWLVLLPAPLFLQIHSIHKGKALKHFCTTSSFSLTPLSDMHTQRCGHTSTYEHLSPHPSYFYIPITIRARFCPSTESPFISEQLPWKCGIAQLTGGKSLLLIPLKLYLQIPSSAKTMSRCAGIEVMIHMHRNSHDSQTREAEQQ